ncbi:MAG: DUF420 domain-containing protein [Chitinophagaceae bacterium]|nr:DUF420 domain-containing protein [Oligoflexus sp.]
MAGFIPTSRGSFVLDFIVVAMGLIVPIMLFSIRTVKIRKNLALHRLIQIGLGITLGIAIVAFELDMRINGWRHLAMPSPYYNTLVFPALIVHLCFAVPTLVLWTYTIAQAVKYTIEKQVNQARNQHKRLGLYSSYSMIGTAITGWIFYYLAFIAA